MKLHNYLSLMFILLGLLFVANIIVLPLATVSVSFGVSNNLNEEATISYLSLTSTIPPDKCYGFTLREGTEVRITNPSDAIFAESCKEKITWSKQLKDIGVRIVHIIYRYKGVTVTIINDYGSTVQIYVNAPAMHWSSIVKIRSDQSICWCLLEGTILRIESPSDAAFKGYEDQAEIKITKSFSGRKLHIIKAEAPTISFSIYNSLDETALTSEGSIPAKSYKVFYMKADETITIISPQNAIFLETNSKQITITTEHQNRVIHIISKPEEQPPPEEQPEEPKPPEGYFTINGEEATSDARIIIEEPEITISFTPTENAENIKEVYIEIWKEALLFEHVTLPAPSYTATYTLPEPGEYQIKGYIRWIGSETPIKKLNITITLPSPLELSINQILGIAFIIIGVTIWIYQRKTK